jgi:indolepyruvate ferredoxin oxidoreductase beta subunit
MEALRYLPWLSAEGWIVTSSVPFVNIPDYPGIDDIMSELKKAGNTVVLDADAIAKDLGSSRSGNMVILGAASSYISLPFESLENAVRQLFKRKGEEVVDLNLKALRAGRDAAGSRKDR